MKKLNTLAYKCTPVDKLNVLLRALELLKSLPNAHVPSHSTVRLRAREQWFPETKRIYNRTNVIPSYQLRDCEALPLFYPLLTRGFSGFHGHRGSSAKERKREVEERGQECNLENNSTSCGAQKGKFEKE